MKHETKRNSRSPGSQKTQGCSAARERAGFTRGRPSGEILFFIGSSLERGSKERRPKSLKDATSSPQTLSPVFDAERRASGTPSPKPNHLWLLQPALDASPNSPSNKGAFRHLLPSCSCLEDTPFFRLDMPEAAAPCPRTEQGGSREVAQRALAAYKKTPSPITALSSLSTRVDLCCSLSCAEHGHLRVRFPYTTSVRSTTASPLLALSASRLRENISTFTSPSTGTTSIAWKSADSLSLLDERLARKSPLFWTNGACTRQGCLRTTSGNIPTALTWSGCPAMPLSLTPRSRSGDTPSIPTLLILLPGMSLSWMVSLGILLLLLSLNSISCVPSSRRQGWSNKYTKEKDVPLVRQELIRLGLFFKMG